MSNLKDSVVIKNQFTNNKSSGFGKTLDKYIMKYVTRKGATESVTPLNNFDFEADDYVIKYMARREATEAIKEQGVGPEELRYDIDEMLGLNGRAFGSEGFSYSEDVLKDSAKEIQDLFDSGHTVLKTVFSFRTEYLQELGIIPQDFVPGGRGSFQGQVDQAKLRLAINSGMKAMTSSAGFSEPVWVGTIQVDTNHVHAHVVTTERGSRENLVDGEERGKLSAKDKHIFRNRFDSNAREGLSLKLYNQQVSESRREIVNDVVNVVTRQYETSAKLQVLIASLPEDTHHWRYGSNAKVMNKPSELMHDYIVSLSQSEKLKPSFMAAKTEIAKYAAKREKMYGTPRKESIDKGLSILEERLSNGIYRHLRSRKLNLKTETEFLKSQAEDDANLKHQIQIANAGDKSDDLSLALMAYRLSQYRKRLQLRSENELVYREAYNDYEEDYQEGLVAPESRPVGDLYLTMANYNAKVADKYRYLLGPEYTDTEHDAFINERNRLATTYSYLKNIYDNNGVVIDVIDDAKFETLKNDTEFLEDNDIPSQFDNDATFLVDLQKKLDNTEYDDVLSVNVISNASFQRQREIYTQDLIDFNLKARSYGLVTHQAVFVDDGGLHDVESLDMPDELTPELFNSVKALDLSSLSYDFDVSSSRLVAQTGIDNFERSLDERRLAFIKASEYMMSTGQNSDAFRPIETEIVQDDATLHYVMANHQLPLDETVSDSFVSVRNLKSISIDESQKDSRQHLQVIEEETEHVIEDLNNSFDNVESGLDKSVDL